MKRLMRTITTIIAVLLFVCCDKQEEDEARQSANQKKNWTCVCEDTYGNVTEMNYYATRETASQKCASNEMSTPDGQGGTVEVECSLN